MRFTRWFAAPMLLALLVLTGCSAKTYHLSTVAVVSAHSTASVVQDTADNFLCGSATAPPEGRCITADVRKQIAAKLSPTFERTGKVAELVKAWPPDAPRPTTLTALLQEITQLLNDVLALFPQSAQDRVNALVSGGAK